ncbi:MAG: TPM domain-containing protein [Planctomycetota bacterium]
MKLNLFPVSKPRPLSWRFVLLTLMLFPLGLDQVEGQRIRISDIPSPRKTGAWIADMSGQVSPEAVKYINLVCQEINDRLGREMTVVVIETTSGRNHREFATHLFQYWGVGNRGIPGAPGVWRDNGVMLFTALADRRAEIILGSGIDGTEQTRICQQIIDDIVIPNFKAGDRDSALYEGIRACGTRIFSVADLDSPTMLPSVSADGGEPRVIRRHRQTGLVNYFPVLIGGGLVLGVLSIFGYRYYLRYRPRHCRNCQLEMIRLEEDQDDQFLAEPEIVEEMLGTVDYDIWACLECETVEKIRYGRWCTFFSKCPKCHYITVHKIETTLRHATTSVGGKVRVVEDCKSCDYHHRYTYLTPRKVKSSSSSGGFRSGGFSSGGSGFGGGTSSGGGAGGGW